MINFLKKNLLTIVFTAFLFFLVMFSKSNLTATKNGLILWTNSIIPSIFPFLIATELLNYTNIAKLLGTMLHIIMKPLFNIPGEGAYALIMGLISGYPVGAKIVLDLYENNICSKNEAERMLSFTNNSGPLFIIGTTGILLFGNSTIGLLLLVTHILSSITVGIVLGISSRYTEHTVSHQKRNMSTTKSISGKYNEALPDLGTILNLSIKKSITTVLQIGGFIVLFSVILSIMNNLMIIDYIGLFMEKFFLPKDITKCIVSGLLELTNGINLATNLHEKNISINIILCAFLLGFGGISVSLQVLSIVSQAHLSMKKYFIGKFFQGLFAALYTALFIEFIPIFKLDIPSVNCSSGVNLITVSLIIFSFIIGFGLILIKSNHKIKAFKYN